MSEKSWTAVEGWLVARNNPLGHFLHLDMTSRDVFSSNLHALPPNHDIKFLIDLELTTQPNSMAPYYLDPTDLKKLYSQL